MQHITHLDGRASRNPHAGGFVSTRRRGDAEESAEEDREMLLAFTDAKALLQWRCELSISGRTGVPAMPATGIRPPLERRTATGFYTSLTSCVWSGTGCGNGDSPSGAGRCARGI